MIKQIIFSCLLLFTTQAFAIADPTPYLMEDSHPLKSVLDTIFKNNTAIQSDAALEKAEFTIVSPRSEGMRVVSHPELKGYLLKLFPFKEQKDDSRTIAWAVERSKNARLLRQHVTNNNMKHFLVPLKWIYFLPNYQELQDQGYNNYAVLVVEDMKITSTHDSRAAWRNVDSKETIAELFSILTFGYSSSNLPSNIPYSKSYKKFTCIDTEKPHKKARYESAKRHFSERMADYWDKLRETL